MDLKELWFHFQMIFQLFKHQLKHTIVVNRVTWVVYDQKDISKVVGTRTQLPLQLA